MWVSWVTPLFWKVASESPMPDVPYQDFLLTPKEFYQKHYQPLLTTYGKAMLGELIRKHESLREVARNMHDAVENVDRIFTKHLKRLWKQDIEEAGVIFSEGNLIGEAQHGHWQYAHDKLKHLKMRNDEIMLRMKRGNIGDYNVCGDNLFALYKFFMEPMPFLTMAEEESMAVSKAARKRWKSLAEPEKHLAPQVAPVKSPTSPPLDTKSHERIEGVDPSTPTKRGSPEAPEAPESPAKRKKEQLSQEELRLKPEDIKKLPWEPIVPGNAAPAELDATPPWKPSTPDTSSLLQDHDSKLILDQQVAALEAERRRLVLENQEAEAARLRLKAEQEILAHQARQQRAHDLEQAQKREQLERDHEQRIREMQEEHRETMIKLQTCSAQTDMVERKLVFEQEEVEKAHRDVVLEQKNEQKAWQEREAARLHDEETARHHDKYVQIFADMWLQCVTGKRLRFVCPNPKCDLHRRFQLQNWLVPSEHEVHRCMSCRTPPSLQTEPDKFVCMSWAMSNDLIGRAHRQVKEGLPARQQGHESEAQVLPVTFQPSPEDAIIICDPDSHEASVILPASRLNTSLWPDEDPSASSRDSGESPSSSNKKGTRPWSRKKRLEQIREESLEREKEDDDSSWKKMVNTVSDDMTGHHTKEVPDKQADHVLRQQFNELDFKAF